jgi:glutamyl-tRNA synthetase
MTKNNTPSSVRVRFAPSPTGHLHIGSLRTAIFNWLFARHHKGSFLLRIEDTDRERSKQEYLDSLLESLRWMSLESDEPLVIQTSRMKEHKEVVEQLIREGKAYRCFCSIDEVQALKEELMAEGKLLKYNGVCRDKNPSAEDLKKPYVVRFKLPYDKGPIVWDDYIRDTVTFNADQLEDFIIVRSDGTPMYNFVVVVDDAAMKITHVIRGEDHISNTPKQILLYQACGYTLPRFAHIPLILGPSGDRLSKRDGAVAALDYRGQGYLPDALFNYLVRLGWAHGDQEIFSRDELVSFFTLEAVGKKGSIFDPVKLAWMNGIYLRDASNDAILNQILLYVEPHLIENLKNFSSDQILSLIALYKERAKTLKDIVSELLHLHTPAYTFDEKEIHQLGDAATLKKNLEQLIDCLSNISVFTTDNVSQAIKQLSHDLGIKLPMLAQPIRLALTGTLKSPGVFDLLAVLKKEESIRRLTSFLQFIEAMQPHI